MNHHRTVLGITIGLLVALATACSGDSETATTTTTVASSTATAAVTTTTAASTSTTGSHGGTAFPAGLLPDGCAAKTARDLAVFEAVLEARPTLGELCAAVGPPDWAAGSGLLFAIYDLDDGGQVWITYGRLEGPLWSARWQGPNGEVRSLVFG